MWLQAMPLYFDYIKQNLSFYEKEFILTDNIFIYLNINIFIFSSKGPKAIIYFF